MNHRRRGFALIAAIWLMVALGALGIEIATLARTRRLSAANRAEATQSSAAAEAGLEHARARLIRLVNDVPTTPSGVPLRDPWIGISSLMQDTVSLEHARYRLRLADANARVNVNLADDATLQRLVRATGAEPETATTLTHAILDWRDADDVSRFGGSEQALYQRAGLPVLPRNAPLVRIEELRDLYGMTPALFERLRPFVSVDGDGRINVNTAESVVLRSLPAFTEDVVGVLRQLRTRGVVITSFEQLIAALPVGNRTSLRDAFAELNVQLTFDTRLVTVESEGWVDGSPVRVTHRVELSRGNGAVFVSAGRLP